jgi:hypothetical protein
MPFINPSRTYGEPNVGQRIANALGGLSKTMMGFAQYQDAEKEKENKKAIGDFIQKKIKDREEGLKSLLGVSDPGQMSELDSKTLPKVSLFPEVNFLGDRPQQNYGAKLGDSNLSSEVQSNPRPRLFAQADVNLLSPQTATDATIPEDEASIEQKPQISHSSQNLLSAQDQITDPVKIESLYKKGTKEMLDSAPDEYKSEVMKALKDWQEVASFASAHGHPEMGISFMDKHLEILSKLMNIDSKSMRDYNRSVKDLMNQDRTNRKSYTDNNNALRSLLVQKYAAAGLNKSIPELDAEIDSYNRSRGITPQTPFGPEDSASSSPQGDKYPGLVAPGVPKVTPGERSKKEDSKRFEKISDYVSGRSRTGVRSPYNMARSKLAMAGAGEAWLNAMALPDSDPRKVAATSQAVVQLARNIDAVVSSGAGGGSVEITKALVPHTGLKKAKDLIQWITANPQDTLSKQYMKQLKNEISTERDVWEKTVADELSLQEAGISDLLDNPEYADRWGKIKDQILSFGRKSGDGVGQSGLTPEQRRKRIEELRKKLGK